MSSRIDTKELKAMGVINIADYINLTPTVKFLHRVLLITIISGNEAISNTQIEPTIIDEQ